MHALSKDSVRQLWQSDLTRGVRELIGTSWERQQANAENASFDHILLGRPMKAVIWN
jgi:hypothetical protein